METGRKQVFEDIARGAGMTWKTVRDVMRESVRYHVEIY
jgi:benzoyl-CoA 2,3-dioxygenase component A